MKFHVYKDSAGDYRWRLKAKNGQIVADSGEGYTTLSACKYGIELVLDLGRADFDSLVKIPKNL